MEKIILRSDQNAEAKTVVEKVQIDLKKLNGFLRI